jgi:hypothetical protein
VCVAVNIAHGRVQLRKGDPHGAAL